MIESKNCVPCSTDIPRLEGDALAQQRAKLGRGWAITEGHHLEKEFTFKDFKEALHFTNQVGQLAEEQGHHPDVYLAWGKVRVTIWTHKINGLSENDFLLAQKIERL